MNFILLTQKIFQKIRKLAHINALYKVQKKKRKTIESRYREPLAQNIHH